MDAQAFLKGPQIDSNTIAWLDENSIGKIVRLPVEIHISPAGLVSAFLDVGGANSEIDLDTHAFSMSLPMKLSGLCQKYPCRVLLEGYWGTGESGRKLPPWPVFDVRSVVGLAGPDLHNVYILPEK